MCSNKGDKRLDGTQMPIIKGPCTLVTCTHYRISLSKEEKEEGEEEEEW